MNLQRLSPDKKPLSGLIIATMFLIVASIPAFGQSPEIKKAFRFIDIEQPSKGLAALDQLVKANPANSSYLYYLGLAQIRTGAKDKALATFDKGIGLNEKDALNYAGKGHVKLLDKNPAEAKVNLDKALSISRSKDANVLKAVAEAYLNDTKFLLDAINALNKAKTINATDPDIHLLLGDAYLIQNAQQGGEAVSSYERAAKSDPKNGKPHHKVGKIFQRARNNDEALRHFTQAVTVDPEYAPAYKELGQLYYLSKQGDKGVQVLEKYLSISENPGDAKFLLAFCYVMARNFEKATAIFKEVTTNPNVAPIAYKYLALSLIEQKKLDEATKAFDQYFAKVKPEDIDAKSYAEYGELKTLLKTPEGDSLANELFAKSLLLDSAQAEVLQLHGDTYLKRKKFPKAIETFKQLMSIRQQPLSQDYWSLGRSYYYNEQFPQADSAFTQLAQRQPNMTVGWQYAARARQQIDSTGALALANPMYDSLIEKALQNPDKYKRELVEAYLYFSSYYINIKQDLAKAKDYLEKILAIDPAHAQAKEALKVINEPAPSKGNKGGKK